MAFLRHLPTAVLLVGALAIQTLAELSSSWQPGGGLALALWKLLFVAGPVTSRVMCPYPLLPWLSIMMLGYVLGVWLLEPRPRGQSARSLALVKRCDPCRHSRLG